MNPIKCQSCGTLLEPEQTTCPNCGAPAPSAAPEQSTPVFVPPVQTASGKGLGWIIFLRVILWILFAACIVAGFGLGFSFYDEDALMAVLIMAGGVLAAFLLVAGGMIALDCAENIRTIAINSTKLVEQNKR